MGHKSQASSAADLESRVQSGRFDVVIVGPSLDAAATVGRICALEESGAVKSHPLIIVVQSKPDEAAAATEAPTPATAVGSRDIDGRITLPLAENSLGVALRDKSGSAELVQRQMSTHG